VTFLTVGFTAVLAVFAGFETNLESPDLILAALFLWIMFFFEALSITENASCNLLAEVFFLVSLTVFLRVVSNLLLTNSRFLSFLSFFFADFVTGMGVF